MRILLWHGWLLEGTGSNVYAAKVAEVWRRKGHEVLVVCQQAPSDRFSFVDAWGAVDAEGVSPLVRTKVAAAAGSAVLLRPEIGALLPVFVYDEYEGFQAKRFVDLSDAELEAYLDRNVAALRSIRAWRLADSVIAGHVVPGPVVARRATQDGGYVAKVHGSDLEFAVKLQPRYADLAREGIDGARMVVGASEDVLARTVEVAPSAAGRTRVIPPGVDVARWRPQERRRALEAAAGRLDFDPHPPGGRPADADRLVRDLLAARDPSGLDALAGSYDQTAPDPDAAARLRALASEREPLIGYLGKLIPPKGVERLVEALALLGSGVRGLVVGFGRFREWLAALVAALDAGDADAVEWLRGTSSMQLELAPDEVRHAAGLARRVTFTGRLDHRYAPEAIAALDVLVVPSTLVEAFGMVAAEGAAAGALPLVARHSSLAEVAGALEGAAGTPGLLSFEPGPGATRRLAEGLERLLSLPHEERRAAREAVRAHVAAEWTWERTADRLLDAAR